MKIERGVYPVLSSKDYHADSDSFSRTKLMAFKEGAYRYWAKYLNPLRPEIQVTDAMKFGSAFHTFILEPHLFSQEYFILPQKVLLKNVGRELYDEYKKIEKEAEACKDKMVLPWDDFNLLLSMQDALYRDRRAKDLIEGAIYEQSYFWQDKQSGLMVKSRPDILHNHMIVDLKAMTDVSPRHYQAEMVKRGYHIQGAMVQDAVLELEGKFIPNVLNVCVESKYPHSVAIYIIDEAALEAGRAEYKNILLELRDAMATNEWRDYEPQTIGLPSWAI